MIHIVNPEDWQQYAEKFHFEVFGEEREKDFSRVDFVLVAFDKEPIGFVQCREFDKETVYMGYGGFVPERKANIKNASVYSLVLSYLETNYKRVMTTVENTNVAMLKLAMSQGFRINGVRTIGGSIMVEMLLEWGEK